MKKALCNVNLWFQRKKLNLNPSKTRFMLFNCNTDTADIVKLGDEYITRVHDKGKESSFKLVRIQIDKKLKWTERIIFYVKKKSIMPYMG